MKKSEAMGWIVYILMLAIAAVVGFAILRPALNNATLPMSSILFILIAVVAGILLAANFLELGHIIGAKIGGYKITKVSILGMQFQKDKEGKFRFGFTFGFDGLTGETAIAPKDPNKANPRHYIYAPLLLLLLEVAACVAFMVIGLTLRTNQPVWYSSYIFALIVLTIVVIVNLYNIFPAALDSKNDGYLMTILNNKTNVLAYNNLLLAQEKMALGEELPETPVYEQVTDFTNSLNQISLYKALSEKNYERALEINEFTIASKDKVSSRVYNNAVAQKLSIHLLVSDFETAKNEYIDLPLENKKYIADLSSAPAVRAYLLVSGLIDESEGETKEALSKADKAIKDSGEEKKAIELELIKESLRKVVEKHPDWDYSDYSFDDDSSKEEKKEESKEETKEENK